MQCRMSVEFDLLQQAPLQQLLSSGLCETAEHDPDADGFKARQAGQIRWSTGLAPSCTHVFGTGCSAEMGSP